MIALERLFRAAEALPITRLLLRRGALNEDRYGEGIRCMLCVPRMRRAAVSDTYPATRMSRHHWP